MLSVVVFLHRNLCKVRATADATAKKQGWKQYLRLLRCVVYVELDESHASTMILNLFPIHIYSTVV